MSKFRNNGNVLVLNQDYTPLNFCSGYRAFILVYMEKAELVEEYESKQIRSIEAVFPHPSIIRLKRYIYIPYRTIPLSRKSIYLRDNHTCAYCGTHKNLTIDHIIPKSRGGKDTWLNLITACEKCNLKKGNKTPEEAKMPLLFKPYKPSYFSFILKNKKIPESWKPFFEQHIKN